MARSPTPTKTKRDYIGRTSDGIYVLRPSTKPTHFTSAEIAKTIKDLKLGLAAGSDSASAAVDAADPLKRTTKQR